MIKKEWDLTKLYKNPKDPQIEKDLKSFESGCSKFKKRHYGKFSELKDPESLKKILDEYEKTYFHLGAIRVVYYFWLKSRIDSFDNEVQSKLFMYEDRVVKSLHNLKFFTISLGKIEKSNQKKLLKDKKLEKYRYFLKQIFDTSKHDLSEDEEKILSLQMQTSYTLWVEGVKKSLSKKVVHFEGKKLPLEEALSMSSTLSAKKRRVLFEKTMEKVGETLDFAESEINSVVLNAKNRDELRGLKKPYSSTAIYFQNTEKEIESVVSSVTKDFKSSSKFYAVKKKALGLKTMEYADRSAPIGKIKQKFTFEESVKIIRKAFVNLDPKFGKILDQMLEGGQISAYPKIGKTGGAFCISNVGAPTYVLLNHTNDVQSLKTFAHEMGHAIHSELSKSQDVIYQDYPISIAEVASTFFEKVLTEEILKNLSDKEKTVLLHNQLNDEVSTVHRQIAAFNFELELHNTVRDRGYQSKEEIRDMLNKHLKKYLGPDVKVPEYVGNSFVYWGHFRRYFYVYSYAYGSLISNTLYAMYKEDPDSKEKVVQFLSMGGSMSPRDIFAKLGIDTQDEETYRRGLRVIRNNINKLDKLISKK